MPYKNLFKLIEIKGLELKNRIVFSAVATNLADKGGFVTERLIDFQVARTLGGCGLNIIGAASVHAPSAPQSSLSISDDKFIPGLKKLTDAIHEAGGKACVQLWQGGLMAALRDLSAVAVIPSEMKIAGREEAFKESSTDTIKECIKAFGEAASRAVKAGFDCVEFHAGSGFSPHMFLSPAFNRRTDEYGGSPENRARYPLECIEQIRKNIPEDMPLFMRIPAQDDCVDNGLKISDVIDFCRMAKEKGADVLDIVRGNPYTAAFKYEIPPIDIPKGFNVENAAKIKEETGMVTIALGRINDPKQAYDIIAQEEADLIGMGRALIADPEFCNKAKEGKEADIIRCIGCNQGCVDRYIEPSHPYITCLRNPSAGREKEYELKTAESPKKVLIAGGGMAGLEAAIVLKQRGHKPVLCEESAKLGGRFLIAGAAPRKSEIRDAALSRGKQAYNEDVDIRLRTRVTAALLDKIDPDAVIIATGAAPSKPDIPGAELPNVLYSQDVLSGKERVEGSVVVIGGGKKGIETAEYLADRKVKATVIEMNTGIGREFGSLRNICLSECLKCERIKTMDKTRCVEIKEGSIIVEREGQRQEIICDFVVLAAGSEPSDYSEIKEYCEKNNTPYYVIGDAKKPRQAIDAIAEAAKIAREI